MLLMRKLISIFSSFTLSSVQLLLLLLEKEQLTSHMRIVMVDAITSLQGYDGRVIPVPEVHDLPNKVYDILDNPVSKWVGKTVCILSSLFKFASRKSCEVWALHFTFLHAIEDTIPPREVYLCGYISWNLAKIQQAPLSGLSWSVRGGKDKTGF